ncbi:hypothetical protein PGT21_006104 [Puccinia graminis f. sp. tritici]|uniref:Uncharacterized protein n=1 Tax=Puccinia graminis f. sp. tritici TaxID=56615 RepID=A0A5B0MZW8_PUCGR|nr:hypothetical protein PGT21_006104 [Puccinia graminis f. sp. tritici]KAA1133580.1 hypothetical protein PGTUg99_025493 [Puccinia graminis f. sp. tritici]
MSPVVEGHIPSIMFACDSANFPIQIPDDPVNTPTVQEQFIGLLSFRYTLAQAMAEIALKPKDLAALLFHWGTTSQWNPMIVGTAILGGRENPSKKMIIN